MYEGYLRIGASGGAHPIVIGHTAGMDRPRSLDAA